MLPRRPQNVQPTCAEKIRLLRDKAHPYFIKADEGLLSERELFEMIEIYQQYSDVLEKMPIPTIDLTVLVRVDGKLIRFPDSDSMANFVTEVMYHG